MQTRHKFGFLWFVVVFGVGANLYASAVGFQRFWIHVVSHPNAPRFYIGLIGPCLNLICACFILSCVLRSRSRIKAAEKEMEEAQRVWVEAQRAYEQARPLVEAMAQAQPRLETLLTAEERRVLGDLTAFNPVWVELAEEASTPEQRKLANAKAYANLQRVVRALKCKLAPGLPMSYQLDTKDGMHFIVDPHYIHRCVPGNLLAYHNDKTCYQVYPQCPGAEKVATALLQLNRNSSYFDFLKNRPGEYVS